MELMVESSGKIRCVYGEELNLSALGECQISRASHVEPDKEGRWWADLTPLSGPRLGPFAKRSDALQAEMAWLHVHWLVHGKSVPGSGGPVPHQPGWPPPRCEVCGRSPGPCRIDRFGEADPNPDTPLAPLLKCSACGLWVCADCWHECECCLRDAGSHEDDPDWAPSGWRRTADGWERDEGPSAVS